MTRLEDYYRDTVVPALSEQFKYMSIMQVPRVQKITLNMGVGEALVDKNVLESAVNDLTKIAGQKPIITKARKSVAAFKVREGWPIGCKVTLRRERMYEFLDRLISVALPRTRGNYSLGCKEQIIFPEVDYDKIDTIRGLDIAITTSAKTDAEAEALLRAFNFPLRN